MLLFSHSTARTQHWLRIQGCQNTCFHSATALPDHSIWLRIQGCRMAHLDRPYQDWATTVGNVPADAMHLPHHGRIAPGLPANMVLFKARGYSELLARPQWDRVGNLCPPHWTPASLLIEASCVCLHVLHSMQNLSSSVSQACLSV